MEAANAAIATVAVITNNGAAADPKPLKVGKSNKKKKVNVLKAALLTLFGRSRKTTRSIQAEVVTDANNLAMLVGRMNNQLIQDSTNLLMLPDLKSNNEINQEETTKNNEEEQVLKNQIVVVEEEDDVINNKSLHGSSCSSECGGDSRYASALNLQELDKISGSSDDDDTEEEFDDTQGDAMIDMKAEMFIAQFYAQMRIQNDITTS